MCNTEDGENVFLKISTRRERRIQDLFRRQANTLPWPINKMPINFLTTGEQIRSTRNIGGKQPRLYIHRGGYFFGSKYRERASFAGYVSSRVRRSFDGILITSFLLHVSRWVALCS